MQIKKNAELFNEQVNSLKLVFPYYLQMSLLTQQKSTNKKLEIEGNGWNKIAIDKRCERFKLIFNHFLSKFPRNGGFFPKEMFQVRLIMSLKHIALSIETKRNCTCCF